MHNHAWGCQYQRTFMDSTSQFSTRSTWNQEVSGRSNIQILGYKNVCYVLVWNLGVKLLLGVALFSNEMFQPQWKDMDFVIPVVIKIIQGRKNYVWFRLWICVFIDVGCNNFVCWEDRHCLRFLVSDRVIGFSLDFWTQSDKVHFFANVCDFC